MSLKIYDMNMVQLNVNDTQLDLYQWVEAGKCDEGRYIVIFDSIDGREVGIMEVYKKELPRRVMIADYTFDEIHGWMYINGIPLSEQPMKITSEKVLVITDNLKDTAKLTIRRYGGLDSYFNSYLNVEVIGAGTDISYKVNWFK